MPSGTFSFIPNPVSTHVVNGAATSYTIPAGKFGWASVSGRNGGYVQLNGADAITTDNVAAAPVAATGFWVATGDILVTNQPTGEAQAVVSLFNT